MEYLRKICTLGLLVIGTSAVGSTLDINEATDVPGGDFARTISAVNYNVGIAMEGTNLISGTITGECRDFSSRIDCNGQQGIADAGDHGDFINFTIETGTELSAITLSTEGSAPAGFRFFSTLSDLGPFAPVAPSVSVQPNRTETVFSDLEAGASDYVFGILPFDADVIGIYDYSWTVQIEVVQAAPSVVPLPAGMALGLTALGALSVVSIRRRRRT